MNWYKEAKLEDKAPDQEHPMFTVCSYCHKYKTDDGDWRSLDEILENAKSNDMEEMLQFQNPNKRLSHGYCDRCLYEHVIKENNLDPKDFGIDVQDFEVGVQKSENIYSDYSAIQNHPNRDEIAPSKMPRIIDRT
jgi:hypothetical protein